MLIVKAQVWIVLQKDICTLFLHSFNWLKLFEADLFQTGFCNQDELLSGQFIFMTLLVNVHFVRDFTIFHVITLELVPGLSTKTNDINLKKILFTYHIYKMFIL